MAEFIPLLTILGVHLKSEGYPNVTYRVQALHACTNMRVREINYPFRADLGKTDGRRRRFASWHLLVTAFRVLYAHLNIFICYLRADRRGVVYIPYPAVLILFLFSILPRVVRPKAIAVDAFISIYDTVVNDRQLARADSVFGRLIWWLENRAYGVADVIVVDTIFNAQYFIETFPSLRTREVVALPLSIDEQFFSGGQYQASHSTCKVVFLGTFVPLQGVETIAKAAVLLTDRTDIHFSLVGNGQSADAVKEILTQHDCNNIEWITDWQSKAQVKAQIVSADICLGIFGSGDKAQRVWPFKNYHYMAIGRALITGDTKCANYLADKAVGAEPFVTVPCGDASALAKAIIVLADSPDKRAALAEAGRKYYASQLSSKAAVAQLYAILERIAQ